MGYFLCGGIGGWANLTYNHGVVPGASISVKLRCRSWEQLASIHSRDLSRNAFFLKTSTPPPVGRGVRISLTLPSGSTVDFAGEIAAHIAANELGGRGPGIDVALSEISSSALWLIESALQSAGLCAATLAPSEPVTDSSIESNEDWRVAESELIQALWQELGSMSNLNPYQLLELPYSAGTQEVRTAFGELSKKYHPDRFARFESFEIRQLSNEVFILVRDAYRSISTSAGRDKVLAGLGHTVPAKLGASPPISQQAAEVMAEQEAPVPSSPIEASSSPVSADESAEPSSLAESPSDFAKALGLIEAGSYESARRVLTVAARRDRRDDQIKSALELVEGLLALGSGNRMEAGERFETALEIDPSNERASREIAAMRRHSTSQRTGQLSKLMMKD